MDAMPDTYNFHRSLKQKICKLTTNSNHDHNVPGLTQFCLISVGHIILVGCLNSFVHILMYTYYFLAGLGPKYQKYLWWKKHMTLVQLVSIDLIYITYKIQFPLARKLLEHISIVYRMHICISVKHKPIFLRLVACLILSHISRGLYN